MDDQLSILRDDLADMYRRQRDAEKADLDGRVTDRVLWRRSIDHRAEEIRRLEQRIARLEQDAA